MNHSLQFQALTDPHKHAAWVVDLASRRVIRRHASLGRAPIEAVTGQTRQLESACPVAKDGRPLPESNKSNRVAPQGGAIRTGTVGSHQHHLRYEKVSRQEQNTASFTRADVEVRAYHVYCARGQGEGLDVDDWLEAERQLRAESGIADGGPTATADPEPTGADEPGSTDQAVDASMRPKFAARSGGLS